MTKELQDELYHYGVLGMKWGVRRYQNADGTFNSAGKRRYGMGDGKTYTGVKKSVKGETVKPAKKKRQSMVDDDTKTRMKKAGKVVNREVIKPAVKSAAITAGLTAAGIGVMYASRSTKGRQVAANVAKRLGQSRVDKITRAATGGRNVVGAVASMPITKAAITAASAAGTARTIYKVHKGFKEEGVYKTKKRKRS